MFDIAKLTNAVIAGVVDRYGYLERGSLPSGLDVIDYLNAGYDQQNNLQIGPRSGLITSFVGGPGAGKSTIVYQSIINLIQTIPDAIGIIFEPERALNLSRLAHLGGWSISYLRDHILQKRLILINDSVETEDLVELIDKVYTTKLGFCNVTFTKEGRISDKTDFTKARQLQGELPPTIIALDSMANLMPRKFSGEGDIDDNTKGMRIAKANSELIQGSLSKFFKANLSLYVINHIRKKVQTNRFAGDERPLKWLKPGENIPGGMVAIYNADHIIRVEQVRKLSKDNIYGDSVFGYEAEIQALKSRSTASGIPFNCIFTSQTGYSNVLTNFELLYSAGELKGSPTGGYYFKDYPDIKMTRKKLFEASMQDPNIANMLSHYAKIYLGNYISSAALGQMTDSDTAEGIDYMERHPLSIIPNLSGPSLLAFMKRYGVDGYFDMHTMGEESVKQALTTQVDEQWWAGAWSHVRSQMTNSYENAAV